MAVVVNETRNVVTRLDKVNGSIARHELKIADLGTDLAKSVADSRRVSIALRHSQIEFTDFYSLWVC